MLGVDPGSIVTGWGLLVGTSQRPRLAASGVIRLSSRRDFPLRLARLRSELLQVLEAQQPSVVAVESPFHGKSSRAALQLAHARGVILATLAESDVEIVEYAPASVKQAVCGNGRADKDQVRRMLGHLLGSSVAQAPDDQADAVAVAWCHASVGAFRSRVAGARQP